MPTTDYKIRASIAEVAISPGCV